MRWEWLRVGRRIEWTLGSVVLLGVLLFGLISFSSRDLFLEIAIPISGGVFLLIMIVPVYTFLAIQRHRAGDGDVVPRRSLTLAGRIKLYVLLFFVILLSAQVQAAYGLVAYVGSASAVYVWNFALFGAVIAWEELLRRRRKRRPPPLNQFK